MGYFRKINPDTAIPVHGFVDRNENTGKDEIFIDTTGANPDNNKSVSKAFGQAIDSTLDQWDCNSSYSITGAINNINNELNELAEKINSNENIGKKKKIKRIKISFSSK